MTKDRHQQKHGPQSTVEGNVVIQKRTDTDYFFSILSIKSTITSRPSSLYLQRQTSYRVKGLQEAAWIHITTKFNNDDFYAATTATAFINIGARRSSATGSYATHKFPRQLLQTLRIAEIDVTTTRY
jgi:hypothetical protein